MGEATSEAVAIDEATAPATLLLAPPIGPGRE